MHEFYIDSLRGMTSFSWSDLLQVMRQEEPQLSESACKRRLQTYLNKGEIVRVGRNMYCVPQEGMSIYQHEYSQTALKAADLVTKEHPLLDFCIFELIQLNEFVNHQLAHNVIFVSVEAEIIDFVFSTLKGQFPGKVLITPTPELYQRYWYDGMIVLEKLFSESPLGKPVKWHTRIEKLLVDIMADRLIRDTISPSEYPRIYTHAFERYVIDESCLFRYARRRRANEEIRRLIQSSTGIVLRTEN